MFWPLYNQGRFIVFSSLMDITVVKTNVFNKHSKPESLTFSLEPTNLLTTLKLSQFMHSYMVFLTQILITRLPSY